MNAINAFNEAAALLEDSMENEYKALYIVGQVTPTEYFRLTEPGETPFKSAFNKYAAVKTKVEEAVVERDLLKLRKLYKQAITACQAKSPATGELVATTEEEWEDLLGYILNCCEFTEADAKDRFAELDEPREALEAAYAIYKTQNNPS